MAAFDLTEVFIFVNHERLWNTQIWLPSNSLSCENSLAPIVSKVQAIQSCVLWLRIFSLNRRVWNLDIISTTVTQQ